MDASQVTVNNNGYLWVVCSFVTFVCANYMLGRLVPRSAKKSPHHEWKWKNIAVSMLHSCITGVWALICFWKIPAMRTDLINSYSDSAQGVISLSVGYFIYDFLDMAINDCTHSRDLLIHHSLVISCFSLSVCTNYYQGYSLVALLVEVNSIFLHLRQLMRLHGMKKSCTSYKINGILNLGTFVIFRVFTMSGMFHWLLTHRADITTTVFALGVFSLIVIMGMNFQLFFRVWRSDYRKQTKSESGQRGEKIKESSQSHQTSLANTESSPNKYQDAVSTQNGKASLITPTGDSKIVNGNCNILKQD